jgi:tetratricopeptide (TPR) repeat protein
VDTLRHEVDAAIREYNVATRLDPDLFPAYDNRARLYRTKGKYDEAIGDYASAMRLQPNEPDAYIGRGIAYYKQGRRREGLQDLAKGEALIHSHVPVEEGTCNTIAWLRATSTEPLVRNGRTAVEMATKACQMTGWKHADCIDTLAAAYAELGDFGRAIEYEKRAIGFSGIAPQDRTKMDARLRLYKQHEPYRDSGS